MEENVHVTQCLKDVQREIKFVFANYIHEPIVFSPGEIKSCVNKFLVESTIQNLSDLAANRDKAEVKNLRQKLARSLILPSECLPDISNQCCHNFALNAQDTPQQTKMTCADNEKREEQALEKSLSTDFSKNCLSYNFSTSSCVSCSSFGSGLHPVREHLEHSSTGSDRAHQDDIIPDQICCNDLPEKKQTRENFKMKLCTQAVTLDGQLNLENIIPFLDFVNSRDLSSADFSKKKSLSLKGKYEENGQNKKEILSGTKEFVSTELERKVEKLYFPLKANNSPPTGSSSP